MRWLAERLAHGGMWLAFEVGRSAVKIFPRPFLLSLSKALADLGFYLFHGFRKRSLRNLSLALGDRLDTREVPQIVRRSLRNFFRDFVEIGFALETSPEEIRAEIPLRGREHLEASLTKGKGAIVLSAHLGNFFLVGTRLASEGYPTYVLVNQPQSGLFPQLMDHYRLRVGQRTIHARPRQQAFRELLRVLRRNELAIVIADEYRSGTGIHVPFLGRTVLARRGPATLALRTGAALVPVYMIRDLSGGLTLFIEPEIELVRSGKIKADVRDNTLRITQWLERTVRTYPDQWNWMNIRWQQTSLNGLMRKEPAAKEITT
ncbi:MAG: lysophospholipid acyltransferase family protein [Candidatus Binatia bacterium]